MTAVCHVRRCPQCARARVAERVALLHGRPVPASLAGVGFAITSQGLDALAAPATTDEVDA